MQRCWNSYPLNPIMNQRLWKTGRYQFEVRRKESNEIAGILGYRHQRRFSKGIRITGDLPLVVLMRDTETPEVQLEINKLLYGYPDFPLQWSKKLDSFWPDLMEEIAALSSNSTLIVVENTSHNIPKENPDSVVDAVRLLLEGE